MHIGKNINKTIRISILLLLAMMLGGCAHKSEPFSIDGEELFQNYDERYWQSSYYGVTSYDIREIVKQIDGFWDYYNEYQKSQQTLEDIIMTWEAEFLTEGTYIVGQDIPAGWYVFCNPKGDGNDDENEYCWHFSKDSKSKDYWRSPYYDISYFKDGEVIKIKGAPKFASIDEFPAFAKADDGNYYGNFYQIGRDIPEGKYFAISMNITDGRYVCFSKKQNYGTNFNGEPEARYAEDRFSYVYLTKEDEYLYMENCVLISMEQKPEIHPIEHEDISDWDRTPGLLQIWFEFWFELLFDFDNKKQGEPYAQPVYAEGEYIIGEDIPLGTYYIQDEIAGAVSDLESEESYYEHALSGPSNQWYSWTGLVIPYEEEAKKCGWKSMRTSRWLYKDEFDEDVAVKCVEIKNVEQTKIYEVTEDNALPIVEFDESEKGCVVRVVRAILIPQ